MHRADRDRWLALALLLAGAVLVWRARPWREAQPARQLAWGVLALIGLHSLLEYPLWYSYFLLPTAFAWGLALASLCAGALQAWLFNISPSSQLWRTDLYEMTGRLLNEFAQGGLLMFSLGCLLFAVLDRGHRMG